MTSPLYENKESIDCEKHIGRLLESKGYSVSHITNTNYPDLFAIKANKRYFIEVKKRTFEYERYPDCMVGLAKMNRYLSMARDVSAEVMLVIVYTNGIYCVHIKDLTQYSAKVFGRTDRGDPQDRQIVLLIPTKSFTEIKSEINLTI